MPGSGAAFGDAREASARAEGSAVRRRLRPVPKRFVGQFRAGCGRMCWAVHGFRTGCGRVAGMVSRVRPPAARSSHLRRRRRPATPAPAGAGPSGPYAGHKPSARLAVQLRSHAQSHAFQRWRMLRGWLHSLARPGALWDCTAPAAQLCAV